MLGRVGPQTAPADPRNSPPVGGPVEEPPVSRKSKYPPIRVGLPGADLLGRDEPLVEIAGDLAQRQPGSPVFVHHSDRRLLGTAAGSGSRSRRVKGQPAYVRYRSGGCRIGPRPPAPRSGSHWSAGRSPGCKGAGRRRAAQGRIDFARVPAPEAGWSPWIRAGRPDLPLVGCLPPGAETGSNNLIKRRGEQVFPRSCARSSRF